MFVNHEADNSIYGRKAQGLIDLSELSEIVIPEIHPISHNDIMSLFKNCGLDLVKEWESILFAKPVGIDLRSYIVQESIDGKISALRDKIKSLSNNESFVEKISELHYDGQSIQDFLIALSNDSLNESRGSSDRSSTNSSLDSSSDQSRDSLSSMFSEGFSLICRSSGDEDKSNSSNPGGNQSFPAENTLEDTAKKIAWVVASYFSDKSFSQRRQGDEDLDHLPQCSVLLQKIIAEKPQDPNHSSDQKPTCISGVTFTNKPDGQTEGLSFTQCTYGSGEGIVQSLVPSDTYISTGHVVNRSVAIKSSRIAPVMVDNDIELTKISNHNAPWTKKSCLNEKEIAKLLRICKEIEEHYGNKPLDIEWVYKDNTFYIVQVRELSKPQRLEEKPNYIRRAKEEKILAAFDTIVPGNTVKDIGSEQEIIAVPNLNQALKIFLKDKDNAHKIKAIFVNEGIATSHEANFFRWVGIPVFAAQDLHLIKKNIHEHPITLCCQTAQMYHGSSNDFNVEDGLYMHPYKFPQSLKFDSKIQDQIAVAFEKTKSTSITPEKTKADYSLSSIRSLIKGLRESDDLDLLYKILESSAYIYRNNIIKLHDRSLESEFEVVFQNIIKAGRDLQNVMQDIKLRDFDVEQYTKRKLYAVNILESVIFQDSNKKFDSTYSLVQVVRASKIQQDYAKILNVSNNNLSFEIKELLIQALKMTSLCMHEDFKQELSQYLQLLAENHRDEFIKTCIMIKRYQQDGLLETIVNMLPDLKDASVSPSESLKFFKSEWARYNSIYSSTIMSDLNVAKEFNDSWQDRIELWGLQETFGALFKQLQPFIESFELRVELLRNTSDPFVKQLLINSLKDSLDIYDAILKELSFSPQYRSKELQSKNFSELLKPYLSLSLQLVKDLDSDPVSKTFIQARCFEEIAENIYNSAKQKGYAYHLEPTPQFNVSSATFTNDANPYKVLKDMRSFADIFTLAHQNSLNVLSVHQAKCLSFSRLPAHVQSIINKCVDKLDIWNGQSASPKLVSWSFIYPTVKVIYNYSLREHSVKISLSYDVNDSRKIVKFNMDMLMNDENNRAVRTRKEASLFSMSEDANHVKLCGYNPVLDLTDFVHNVFEWDIDMGLSNADDLDIFKNHIENLMKITIGDSENERKFTKDIFYYPGMFKNSFAGINESLRGILASRDEELIFNAMSEILNSMLEKLQLGIISEIKILTENQLSNTAPLFFNVSLKMLLSAGDSKIRLKMLGLLTDFITNPLNFKVLVEGCLLNKHTKKNFYFINNLYDLVTTDERSIGIDSSNIKKEAKELKEIIIKLAKQYEPLSLSTPESIRVLYPKIVSVKEAVEILANAHHCILDITDINEFMKQAKLYHSFHIACYEKVSHKFMGTIYLDWLAKNPEHIEAITGYINKSGLIKDHLMIGRYEVLQPEQAKYFVAILKHLVGMNLREPEKLSNLVKIIDESIPNLLNFDYLIKDMLMIMAQDCHLTKPVVDKILKYPDLFDIKFKKEVAEIIKNNLNQYPNKTHKKDFEAVKDWLTVVSKDSDNKSSSRLD